MNLPVDYLDEMKELLQEEYDDYLASFDTERSYGLRVNTSKISVQDFLNLSPFHLTPIPWCKDGFYVDNKEEPSKHPYYYAGLYYLQEPSAMLPAEVLPVCEYDKVLDACAAPGGKSCKLANKLKGTGVLFSNDISASRSQISLLNLEKFGISNAYVTAEDIQNLHSYFEEYFDAILVDAPCSGEGMFRKDNDLIKSWNQKGPDYYAPIQKKILMEALSLLKEGGKLVYSTCTFSIQEDEEVIEYALSQIPNLKVLPIPPCKGFVPGRSEHTKNCVRLYPHKIKGEGHFVALLQKGETIKKENPTDSFSIKPKISFLEDVSKEFKNGRYQIRDNKYYYEPSVCKSLKGLRVLRSGLYLGECKHDKFEPSQALAMALQEKEFDNILNFPLEDIRVIKYLKCETLDVKDKHLDGIVLVCVDHYPLGFGVINKGILKNKYPANYRFK